MFRSAKCERIKMKKQQQSVQSISDTCDDVFMAQSVHFQFCFFNVELFCWISNFIFLIYFSLDLVHAHTHTHTCCVLSVLKFDFMLSGLFFSFLVFLFLAFGRFHFAFHSLACVYNFLSTLMFSADFAFWPAIHKGKQHKLALFLC